MTPFTVPPRIAHRAANLAQSEIRRMTRECDRVGGINLGQGICDLPTHPLVREGAITAIRENRSTYSFPEGTATLRQAIAEKLVRENGIRRDPQTDIVVTLGATGAFTATLMALLNPGDGLLLFEPYYGYHLNTALLAGLEPQFVTLEGPGFHLDEARLRNAVRANTRAIVVCTPSNPSGKMFTRDELEIVARVAHERDLLVITDEIYEYFRYDGRAHVSPATIEGLEERTVTIMGLSKTFSITGWRLGYAVAPAELAQPIALVNDVYYVCAPTPLQLGAAAGFAAPASYFLELRSSYQKKRDMICEALEAACLTPVVPEGAYYVLADLSRSSFDDARQASMALLERSGVASIAGTAFFESAVGERFLRFCFAKEDDVLAEACMRIRATRL
ncbi:MAG TPA: pyridoxal phosphate-dependent aminotransferase [Polyangiaceae bacterium]